MTKAELKEYLIEAVDAMDQAELEQLFPPSNQPDLYTLAEEFTGLKGAVKKLAQSSLKVQNDMQQAMAENNGRWEKMVGFFAEQQEEVQDIDPDLKAILNQLIEQDDLIHNTQNSFQELTPLRLLNINEFKKQLAAWQKGYEIMHEKWTKFMKGSGLYKTGSPGQMFDPNYHEAVHVANHSDKPDNVILETEVVGFLFKNKTVRQAKVVVNKKAVDGNLTNTIL